MFAVKRSHHNPILVPNRDYYWEAYAAFNMSVVRKDSLFYGVYRAVSAPDALRTPERISVIGVGVSRDGTHFGERMPLITPEEDWEKYGCEDPRVTYFEGNYYIFYTALSKYPFEASGIRTAVAVSKDLRKIKERRLVTPFNAKAMTLFPERIGGKVTVVLSVNTDMPPAKMAIAQADQIEDLWNEKFWEEWYKNIDSYTINLKRSSSDHTEVGAAPIRIKEGWFLVYSHIQNYFSGGDRIFGVEAIILDADNPLKILHRTRGPVFSPQESYELLGHVSDVVFPTGAILRNKGESLHIYYGAADTTVSLAEVSLKDLVETMREGSRWHFKRSPKNPIIAPNKERTWEAKATFNPGAVRLGGATHLLYRALSEDNTSSIGYASTKDGVNIDERLSEPAYVPREDFELKKISGANSGCEDPRLTKIGKTIYMCYTAFDGVGPPRVAITSIAEKDFLQKNWKWEKPTLITPAGFDDKDTCIFPEKSKKNKTEYFILHRVGNEICGDYLKSADFKKDSVKKCIHILGPRVNGWDSAKVGICAPPIKTAYGWLLFYHGVSKSHNTYRVGAVLLDLKDPAIVLARTTDPIFEPEEEYEKTGLVNNVVFPCGVVEKDGLIYIYYGGADKVVGVATIELEVVLKALGRGMEK